MPVSASNIQLAAITAASNLSQKNQEIFFSGLEFDSREIKGGELFVALPGEQQHGNLFIKKALEKGAALVLAESDSPLPEVDAPEKILLVDDTLKAFWKLASWWRKELALPTMAITGSVGKTTCKEMAASILKQVGPGCYSLKSHNNHVGVPYTICRSSIEDKWLILEVGMNNRGEIAPLSELSAPDLAVISTIAPAHIGNLGSIENIIDEKLDIQSGLKAGGILLTGLDHKLLFEKAKQLSRLKGFQLENFGFEADNSDNKDLANIRKLETRGFDGLAFEILTNEDWKPVHMKVLGRKNAQNAACAAKACKLLLPELSTEQIVSGLEKFEAPQMRLNLKKLADGSMIIDDSYNANPASMKAGLELLFDLGGNGCRLAVVLGDMLELGNFSEEFHKDIAGLLASKQLNFVAAVGKDAKFYLDGFEVGSEKYAFFENPEEACAFISELSFDLLLVKGSRGIGLEKVVNFLVEQRGQQKN